MTGELLLRSMADIDLSLIMEAEDALLKRKRSVSLVRLTCAVAASLCLFLGIALPTMAASDNDAAYEILYSISPHLAQKLKPINISSIDNGIEMNVIGAETDGDKAEILVEFRDIAENRIDESIDLFDSYSIHTPYDQMGGCSLASYDVETGQAIFMIEIQHNKNIPIAGDKITFSVDQILTSKKSSVLELTQIDKNNLPIVTDFSNGFSISQICGVDANSKPVYETKYFMPCIPNPVILESGVTLTGYGIVNNRLHVQIKYDNVLKTDNHGFIYLKDKNGFITNYEDISYYLDENGNHFVEYSFPVSQKDIGNYEIWGDFLTCNQGPIEGHWQITFPIRSK